MTKPSTVLVLAGIRSQYIKVAALQRVTNVRTSSEWTYVDVGQHYDDELAGQYVAEYDIRFASQLQCGRPDLMPTEVLGRMIVALEGEIAQRAPCVVMVLGDANCTLAGVLAATNLGVPVVHLEAGVRTHAPTTEERNRVVIDAVSGLHLAASTADLQNLVDERRGATARFVGDVVQDLVRPLAESVPDSGEPYCVLTMHRAENTADSSALEFVCSRLQEVGLPVYLLGHPRVLRMLTTRGVRLAGEVEVLPSTSHARLVELLVGAAVVVTDSGALQREAYYVGTRAVVLQEAPFWPSLVRAGYNLAVRPFSLTPQMVREAMEPFTGTFYDFGTPPVVDKVVEAVEEWVDGFRAR